MKSEIPPHLFKAEFTFAQVKFNDSYTSSQTFPTCDTDQALCGAGSLCLKCSCLLLPPGGRFEKEIIQGAAPWNICSTFLTLFIRHKVYTILLDANI